MSQPSPWTLEECIRKRDEFRAKLRDPDLPRRARSGCVDAHQRWSDRVNQLLNEQQGVVS